MGNKADSYPQYVPASKQHWKTTTDCAIKGDLISWSLLGNGLLWSPVNDTIYRPLQFHWMITVFSKNTRQLPTWIVTMVSEYKQDRKRKYMQFYSFFILFKKGGMYYQR